MLNRLGYSNNDRLIIISADDFGMNSQANNAIMELLEVNANFSTSLIAPADFFHEATKLCGKLTNLNVGIHLTLTDGYRPTSSPEKISTLLNKSGHFPQNPYEIEKRAVREHVKYELQNQIEKVITSGIDPTHLDNHQGSLFGFCMGLDFLDIAFELCELYSLPFLFPKNIVNQSFLSDERKKRFNHLINLADEKGIPLIDDLVMSSYTLQEGETYQSYKSTMINAMKGIKPGITQVVIHPEKIVNVEQTSIITNKREMEYKLFIDRDTWNILKQEGIVIISWKEIRDLYRRLGQ